MEIRLHEAEYPQDFPDPKNSREPGLTRRQLITTSGCTAIILGAIYFNQQTRKWLKESETQLAQSSPHSPKTQEQKSPHDIMLQIFSSFPHHPSQNANYYSFHPLGTTDEAPLDPLYAVPYKIRIPDQPLTLEILRTEYLAYQVVGIAHTNGAIESIRIAGIPGNIKIPAKQPTELKIDKPLSFKEYTELVNTHKSTIFSEEQISLAEIVAMQFPQLSVQGVEMIKSEEVLQRMQELKNTNEKITGTVFPVINHYIETILRTNEEPSCSIHRDAEGKISSVQIGEKTYENALDLIDTLALWVQTNEGTAGHAAYHAEKIAGDINVKDLLLIDPDLMRSLEVAGPSNGRSVFMPNPPILDHRLMQPVPFDEVVSKIRALIRKLDRLTTPPPLPHNPPGGNSGAKSQRG